MLFRVRKIIVKSTLRQIMLEAHWSFGLPHLFLSITPPSSLLSLSHLFFSFLFPPTALSSVQQPIPPPYSSLSLPASSAHRLSPQPRRLMCCLGSPVVAADANADYHHNVLDSTRLVNRPGHRRRRREMICVTNGE